MISSLIGLSGKKRAGKDTVAAHLVANYGYTRYAFADIMRTAALALDPIIPQHDGMPETVRLSNFFDDAAAPTVEEWEIAKANPEVRRLLQRLGTEVGRDLFGEDFWVEQTFDAIDADNTLGADARVVITDVRFPNEAASIHRNGGIVVRVHRPMTVPAILEHPSETALDGYGNFDHSLVNDHDIAALHDRVDDMMFQLTHGGTR